MYSTDCTKTQLIPSLKQILWRLYIVFVNYTYKQVHTNAYIYTLSHALLYLSFDTMNNTKLFIMSCFNYTVTNK